MNKYVRNHNSHIWCYDAHPIKSTQYILFRCIYGYFFSRSVENLKLQTYLIIRSWKLALATKGTTLHPPPPKNLNGLTLPLLVASLGLKMDPQGVLWAAQKAQVTILKQV